MAKLRNAQCHVRGMVCEWSAVCDAVHQAKDCLIIAQADRAVGSEAVAMPRPQAHAPACRSVADFRVVHSDPHGNRFEDERMYVSQWDLQRLVVITEFLQACAIFRRSQAKQLDRHGAGVPTCKSVIMLVQFDGGNQIIGVLHVDSFDNIQVI
eukprot:362387-Chlamydomonas_euryale.AAC.5